MNETIRPDFLILMDNEEAQLRDRIEKGTEFLHSPARIRLQPTEHALLDAQLQAMRSYHSILLLRIQRAEGRL